MNNDWKDTFHYTQLERKGIFVLSTLLVCLLFYASYLRHSPQSVHSNTTNFTAFKKAIADFEKETTLDESAFSNTASTTEVFAFNPNIVDKTALLALGLPDKIAQRIINYREKGGVFRRKEDLRKIYGLAESDYIRLVNYIELPVNQSSRKTPATIKKQAPLRPFRFDPNNVSLQELVQMGLNEKTAQQIINYRKKGGVFYKKEDFRKIYSLSATKYQQLAPFILIKNKEPQKKAPPSKGGSMPYVSKPILKIDINKATEEEWQQLRGIGPYYAQKIVNFREKLGGFSSIGQVGDTYHFPDTVFQKIQTQLVVSPIFRKLAINTAPLETLQAHPFLRYNQAKVLVNYRTNHGHFKSAEDLMKVKVLSREQIERLRPYLTY